MRIFQAYQRWNNVIYVYDGVANAILCLENGVWSVREILPEKTRGQSFTTISVCEGNLYLYGRTAKYIVKNCLANNITEIITLPTEWVDEKGYFFSNLLFNDCEMLLFPFRGNQVRLLDLCGNAIKKDWQANFTESIEWVRSEYNMAQIRCWGAHIINDKVYAIMAGTKRDRLVIYDIHTQKIQAVPIGTYREMYSFSAFSDGFFVQGICDESFYIAKLDFNGKMLQDVKLRMRRIGLHIQWVEFEKCFIVEDDKLYIVDRDLGVQEIPLFSVEGFRLHYINTCAFVSSKGLVFYIDGENGVFSQIREKKNAGELLLTTAEYKKRIVYGMRKQLEIAPIGEEDGEIGLKFFLEIISSDQKNVHPQSNIGDSLWSATAK